MSFRHPHTQDLSADALYSASMSRLQQQSKTGRGLFYDLIYPFKNGVSYFGVALVFCVLLNTVLWTDSFNDPKTFVIALLWSFAHWNVQSLGNGLVIYKIDQRITWIEQPWKRAILGFVSLVLFSAPAFIVVQTLFIYLYRGSLPSPFFDFAVESTKIAIIVSLSIAFVLTTVAFLKNWRMSTVEAERLKAEMMTYKYESLRNQINPHFLFNSLNTLSDLVYEDQATAVKFIRQMSDLYRYVLDSSEREAVPLREELDFIDSFAYLLQTRFEDKLHFNIDVPMENDDLIVPMALQNLVENAVKHNEVSSKHPLTVTISRSGDMLQVSNLIQKKRGLEERKGTGLQNIRARYEYLTTELVTVEEKEGSFIVSLPILKSHDR